MNCSNSVDIQVAEYFAGIGLMRLGLERQGCKVVFANDIDPLKQQMYEANFGPEHFVLGNIHEIDVSAIPDTELATASFPCTDLSLAGGRAGLVGSQSGAFFGFIKVLNDMGRRRPKYVLLENVTSFLSSRNGSDFRTALVALNQLGYAVDTFMLDAAWFVPQSRQRLFVVGIQREDDSPVANSLPMTTLHRPKAVINAILSNFDLRWEVHDLPAPPKLTTKLEEMLDDVPDGSPEWWDEKRAVYLLSQMSPRHRSQIEKMIVEPNWSYATCFRRTRNGVCMAELRIDGLAGCLRTPKGGSAKQILLKVGYEQYGVRLLTPRECARLMGAEEYLLPQSRDQSLFGFGDAVCVNVIEWIAKNYLSPLIREVCQH